MRSIRLAAAVIALALCPTASYAWKYSYGEGADSDSQYVIATSFDHQISAYQDGALADRNPFLAISCWRGQINIAVIAAPLRIIKDTSRLTAQFDNDATYSFAKWHVSNDQAAFYIDGVEETRNVIRKLKAAETLRISISDPNLGQSVLNFSIGGLSNQLPKFKPVCEGW